MVFAGDSFPPPRPPKPIVEADEWDTITFLCFVSGHPSTKFMIVMDRFLPRREHMTPDSDTPNAAMFTKKQVRKLVHDAFKAGLINVYHARATSDLSGQNSRLYALKRLFPQIFTEGQPGHVTREQERAARSNAKRLKEWQALTEQD
jgi:hypothetical protein